MAGTFSQLYIQVVFAVKGRQNLLQKPWRKEVFAYMSGIITHQGHKSIIVNGVSDHIHAFIGLKPAYALSDLVRDVKNNSTNYINRQGWVPGRFAWQSGYGAFSYHQSQIQRVYRYILNQEAHHQKTTFREEYLAFLKEYEVSFEEQYLFDWLESKDGFT